MNKNNRTPHEEVMDINRRLNACDSDTVPGLLAMGSILKDAREAMGRSRFTQTGKSEEFAVSGRDTYRFLRILDNEVISDPNMAAFLPPSIHPLDGLARLSPSLLRRLLVSGIVNSETRTSEARDTDWHAKLAMAEKDGDAHDETKAWVASFIDKEAPDPVPYTDAPDQSGERGSRSQQNCDERIEQFHKSLCDSWDSLLDDHAGFSRFFAAIGPIVADYQREYIRYCAKLASIRVGRIDMIEKGGKCSAKRAPLQELVCAHHHLLSAIVRLDTERTEID